MRSGTLARFIAAVGVVFAAVLGFWVLAAAGTAALDAAAESLAYLDLPDARYWRDASVLGARGFALIGYAAAHTAFCWRPRNGLAIAARSRHCGGLFGSSVDAAICSERSTVARLWDEVAGRPRPVPVCSWDCDCGGRGVDRLVDQWRQGGRTQRCTGPRRREVIASITSPLAPWGNRTRTGRTGQTPRGRGIAPGPDSASRRPGMSRHFYPRRQTPRPTTRGPSFAFCATFQNIGSTIARGALALPRRGYRVTGD
jgi:hypothetical protein